MISLLLTHGNKFVCELVKHTWLNDHSMLTTLFFIGVPCTLLLVQYLTVFFFAILVYVEKLGVRIVSHAIGTAKAVQGVGVCGRHHSWRQRVAQWQSIMPYIITFLLRDTVMYIVYASCNYNIHHIYCFNKRFFLQNTNVNN